LAEFDTGFAAVAGRFGQVEPRRQARAFRLGLLSDVDARSCWQLAEQAGDASPHAVQRLLGEAAGTPTACVMMCAAMWSTRSATRAHHGQRPAPVVLSPQRNGDGVDHALQHPHRQDRRCHVIGQ
jgi:hypothetical protein